MSQATLVTPADRRGARHLHGILLMLLGVAIWAISDVLGKWLVRGYPVSEILLIRSVAALMLLAPFLRRAGAGAVWRAPRPWLQCGRAALSTLEAYCFYFAVARLPLADTLTYYMATPIFVTALSALLLRERVGWRRWSAVLAGFGGVVIALHPSARSLDGASLVALAGTLCFAVLLIATRVLRGTDETVLLGTQLASALVPGAVLAPFAWVAPGGADLFLLALVGVLAMLGYLCVNRALRLADASVVTPFQYTMIVWAMIFGLLVFGDMPRPRTVLGAGLIVAAGLFIAMRERHAAAQP